MLAAARTRRSSNGNYGIPGNHCALMSATLKPLRYFSVSSTINLPNPAIVIGAFIGDWLVPRLGIHLGVGIVVLIVNAFIGAIILLLILRLVGGSLGCRGRWGRRW